MSSNTINSVAAIYICDPVKYQMIIGELNAEELFHAEQIIKCI
jgi:hypothetical protein